MKQVRRSIFIELASVIVACICVSACAENALLYAPGDPCRSLRTSCVDEETVFECVDETWVETACADYCEGLAPGVSAAGCSEEACVCVPPEGGCTPGESLCADNGDLEWCGDSWEWTVSPCDEVCAMLDPQKKTLGCFPSDEESDTAHCLCTSAGVECSAESPAFCVDESERAECIDGVWVYQACAEECSEGVSQCSPEPVSGAQCVCSSP